MQRPVGAAARDLDGVLQRLGQISEQRPHLRTGLEVMLGAQAAPVVDRDVASLGDADQRVMRLEILLRGEIGFVGRDDGQVEVISELEQLRLDRPLLRQAVALKLDIEPVAEDRVQRLEPRAGELGIALGERHVDRPFEAAGERDQTFGPRGELADAGNRLAQLAGREIDLGREAHQIGVALRVLGEQRDAAVGTRPVEVAAGRRGLALGGEGQREREPDDRLDAGFGESLGEFQRAEEIVRVGQRERGSTVSFG